MPSLGNILIVDDDEDILQALRLLLRKHARTVHTETDPERLLSSLQNQSFDLILLDMNFREDVTSGREGFAWLDRILEIDPLAVVVLITAYGDVEMAVRAIKEGATDFVLKPWQNEKLLATLSAAMTLRTTRQDADRLRNREQQWQADMDEPYLDFVGGAAPAMQHVFTTIQKVAATDANVLVYGENGTGKELVARALHRQSERAEDVFVSVDMGAVPDPLFESELFGHVKGAFTDAREDRAGRFEMASGGTLFLDEIGNVSLPQQAKLLTVLERREVIRVGSNIRKPIDVRLICATNQDLRSEVKTDSFRQDLLYRINTVEIQLPPLRERVEDIPLLVEHFIGKYARKYDAQIRGIHPAATKKMKAYGWPGNVRELEHMIERAVIMTESQRLQPEDFFFVDDEEDNEHAENVVVDDYDLENVEKAVIRKAVTRNDGNITRTAEELGISRSALYRRLKKYGL